MQHTRCVFSPARALQNVFLSHLDLSARRSMAAAPSSISRPAATYLYPRLFSTNGGSRMKLFVRRPYDNNNNNNAKNGNRNGPETPASRFPTDNDIPYKWVKVADETGALSEPQRTSDVLAALDRQKYSLAMVAPPPEPKEEEESDESLSFQDMPLAEPEAAICRIIDKHAYAKMAEEKEKEARRKKLNTKELELNWAIAPNDLGHKVTQLQSFLTKGKTVMVMMAKKRRGRVATKEEAEALLEKLTEAATEAGAALAKKEGTFPGVVNLKFEGRKKS
ncbi:translation initiation factor RLI1 [Apiospora arundinis]|uniref:Translation initiation factor IF-3 n=1 Tax=Apiospora arundinis TaxID=335852 RepID=A0ABR2I402_9PEZI